MKMAKFRALSLEAWMLVWRIRHWLHKLFHRKTVEEIALERLAKEYAVRRLSADSRGEQDDE